MNDVFNNLVAQFMVFSVSYGAAVETALQYLQKMVLAQFGYKITGELLGLFSFVAGYLMGVGFAIANNLTFLNAIIFGFVVMASATGFHQIKNVTSPKTSISISTNEQV